MAQETVIKFYKRTGTIRNPQGHIANIIQGVRNVLEDGLSYDEIIRINSITGAGTKMSHKPCRWFPSGRCERGMSCHHIHTTTSSYDKGSGKGSKGMDSDDYDAEFFG